MQIVLAVVYLGSSSTKKFSLILIGLTFQCSLLCRGFCYLALQKFGYFKDLNDDDNIRIDEHDLIDAFLVSFAAQICLSFIEGKVAHINLLMTSMIFVPFINILNVLLQEALQISDPGNGLCIHLFSSIYGCAVNWILFSKETFEGIFVTYQN